MNTSQSGSLLRRIQWPRAEELSKSTAMCSLSRTIMKLLWNRAVLNMNSLEPSPMGSIRRNFARDNSYDSYRLDRS